MRVCSLFCGIGGIDLAFTQAGHEIVWANDIDKYACMTYRHNFSDTVLVEGDIRAIDKHDIPDFDILAAGFPCQPFSVCGKQKGFSDERGNLFFEIGKVIDAKHPSIVFLENVANLTEHDHGKTFNVIHNELAGRGYFIRYLIADACDYGIPQHRTRTYIVAFSNRTACEKFTFPEKVPLEKRITDIIDITVKADDKYYYSPDSAKYQRLSRYITDEKQLYRFADYGIQSSKYGISFTLKANMGTYYDRVPIIKDNFGIRNITPTENEIEQSIQKIKEDARFKSLTEDCSLQSAIQSIQLCRESIYNLNNILTGKAKELDELNKLCLEDSAKTKEFTSLKEYYAEELQKLQAISCYQDFVSQLPHIACPFCKQTIEPKALNDSDMEILYSIWNTNKEELLKKQQEISCSIADIENRLHENLLKRENLQQEIQCLENTIDKKQEELELINDSMAKMRELYEMRYNLESLNKQLQSVITSIEEYSKNDNIKKENLSIAVNKEKYDNYCSIILKTLTDWGFPNISELHFDAKTLDLSINSKFRKTWGKGYRAFIMAAMTISLMRYCINYDYMHPGFVIIDSPLVSLKERKKTNESEYIDSYMEQKMIENIVKTDAQNQVIIFENKDLKFNLEYNYVEFYHGSDIKGVIPQE